MKPAPPEAVLESRRILVCVGSGGVGKTTVSAALALEAARRGRRALVLTIDPARRLADALGLESLGLTPASLRAGGATERYLQREPIADFSWLLRHADLNTTWHYIQSAAAMLALARIPAAAADEVERRAKAAARDLRAIVQSAPPPRVVVKRPRSRSVPV